MMKIFRKSFDINLDDALTYPTSKTICETIAKNEDDIEFLSEESPVTFKKNNLIYEVEIKMARGGYILTCIETK